VRDSPGLAIHVPSSPLSVAVTDCWSGRDKLPAFRRINQLWSVKSFIRTFDADRNPALEASIGTSIGHGGLSALVIIARMV
jgi:hypothetical protein